MDIPAIISQHEGAIRLGFFLGTLALMLLWEVLAPRRKLTAPRTVRWFSNLGIVVIDTIVVRLVFFVMVAVGMAEFAATHGWGLLNWLGWPYWLEVIVGVVLLDFAIYLQHIMVHAVPALWRLHRVHHADIDFDATTGLRFHPLEIIVSMLIKFAVIAALGPAVLAVIIFEVVLNAVSIFNHGNVSLPAGLDRVVRWFIVTPDMHRVHHSIRPEETNSNFGFNLTIWDRLLGTYCDQPVDGHDAMTIGIDRFREPAWWRLDKLLLIPFSGDAGGYPINRRAHGDSD